MRFPRVLLPFLLVLAFVVAPTSSAHSADGDGGLPEEIRQVLGLRRERSTSLGAPGDGTLRGGVAFPMRGPGFRFGPLRDPHARYGTVEVVRALVRAALSVHRDLPGGELTVNDLSLEHGGPIPHHGSHRAGRDVDVLFYMLDRGSRPTPSVGVPLDPAGEGVDFKNLVDPSDDLAMKLDVPRSWKFVEHVLLDGEADVSRIFVAEHLRTLLLAHARASGAPRRAIERFSELTCQPSYPHDDHFHFRFFCSADDVALGCTDAAPIYPWHVQAMQRLGVAPVLAHARRARPRATVTTEEEARAAAGPMDATVTAWLARREAWRSQPHPGRRYCR